MENKLLEIKDLYVNAGEKEILKGFDGDYQSEAILKFRQTITNINEMICDDMKDLFLGYYGGVEYGLSY